MNQTSDCHTNAVLKNPVLGGTREIYHPCGVIAECEALLSMTCSESDKIGLLRLAERKLQELRRKGFVDTVIILTKERHKHLLEELFRQRPNEKLRFGKRLRSLQELEKRLFIKRV